MVSKIIASVVVVLAASAGVAYAATQLASSDGTQVCVNQTNGLMRAASTCREGEQPMTIGGGSNVVVTQNGTFTVSLGQSSGKTLPLTGITVSGVCAPTQSPNLVPGLASIPKFDAATGKTLDMPGANVFGGQSVTLQSIGGAYQAFPTSPGRSHVTVVATSNGATAAITMGATASWGDQTCTFLWQATEAPN